MDWKTGIVAAIYKKGTKSDMGNYRQVSLTSVVCKILESIIRDHIIEHLIVNKLISNKQYGFMKGRSTSLQLLHMLDNCSEFLESGGQIDAIYTDFEKAFDKVPHKRLIKKLQTFGITTQIIQWVRASLTSRKTMCQGNWRDVQIDGCSQWYTPGHCTEPLLLIIYINDLPNICTDGAELYLFADDAKLFKFVTNLQHH